MPSAAITSAMHVLGRGHALGRRRTAAPWRVAFAAICAVTSANSSGGNVDVSGSPPASEMTSGRSVIAMRSRIADDVITAGARGEQPGVALEVARGRSCPGPAHGHALRHERAGPCRLSSPAARYRTHELLPRPPPGRRRRRRDPASGPSSRPSLTGALATADSAVDFDGHRLRVPRVAGVPHRVIVFAAAVTVGARARGTDRRAARSRACSSSASCSARCSPRARSTTAPTSGGPALIAGAAAAALGSASRRGSCSAASAQRLDEEAAGAPARSTPTGTALLVAAASLLFPPLALVALVGRRLAARSALAQARGREVRRAADPEQAVTVEARPRGHRRGASPRCSSGRSTTGRAPALKRRSRSAGTYARRRASRRSRRVTPVCAASIATGTAPGRPPHPVDELVLTAARSATSSTGRRSPPRWRSGWASSSRTRSTT